MWTGRRAVFKMKRNSEHDEKDDYGKEDCESKFLRFWGREGGAVLELVGMPRPWVENDSEPSDHYTTKIGGLLDWSIPQLLSSKPHLLQYATCEKDLYLVAQVYAPIFGKSLKIDERVIYVLGYLMPTLVQKTVIASSPIAGWNNDIWTEEGNDENDEDIDLEELGRALFKDLLQVHKMSRCIPGPMFQIRIWWESHFCLWKRTIDDRQNTHSVLDLVVMIVFTCSQSCFHPDDQEKSIMKRSTILRQTLILISQPSNALTVSPLRPSSQKIVSTTNVPTLSGSRWFVTFIDDCTRMTWLYLMKTKDEVNLLFQNFHKVIETQYNAKVRVLRSDNGGEYQSSDLQRYLEGHGIIHHTTCFNTPSKMESLNEKIGTSIPNSVQEALVDPRWKAAMNEEMKSL
ncbi:hypothetical protein AAG906_004756 [Vitis piasezkii]